MSALSLSLKSKQQLLLWVSVIQYWTLVSDASGSLETNTA